MCNISKYEDHLYIIGLVVSAEDVDASTTCRPTLISFLKYCSTGFLNIVWQQGQCQGKLLGGAKTTSGSRGQSPLVGVSGQSSLKLTPFKCYNRDRSPFRAYISLLKM